MPSEQLSLLDWQQRAEMAESRLVAIEEKLAALQDAAWDVLSALEGGDPDQVVKARRRLGLVFLDL